MNREQLNAEIKHEMALTRAIAERLSVALDRELHAQSERSRATGAVSTLSEAEAELARATERLRAIEGKAGELDQRARHAFDRFDVAEMQAMQVATDALLIEAEPIAAEVTELKALVAELSRVAG